MQTEQSAQGGSAGKKGSKLWIVPVALAAGIFIALFIRGGADPDQKVVIGTTSEYNDVLKEAELQSKDVLPKLSKGETLTDEDKQKLVKAAKNFEALVAYEPGRFAPQLALGMIYRGLGNLEQSERFLRSCLLNIPDSNDAAFLETKAEAHYQLSLVAFELNLYGEAVTEASEALKLSPQNPNYYVSRASAYLQLKKNAEARKDLEGALKLDPTNNRARGILKLMDGGAGSTSPEASS